MLLTAILSGIGLFICILYLLLADDEDVKEEYKQGVIKVDKKEFLNSTCSTGGHVWGEYTSERQSPLSPKYRYCLKCKVKDLKSRSRHRA